MAEGCRAGGSQQISAGSRSRLGCMTDSPDSRKHHLSAHVRQPLGSPANTWSVMRGGAGGGSKLQRGFLKERLEILTSCSGEGSRVRGQDSYSNPGFTTSQRSLEK